MGTSRARALFAAALTALALCVSGCGLQGSPSGGSHTRSTPQSPASPGEGQGTVPPSAEEASAPLHPAATPDGALAAFATLYVNWTYQTLAQNERSLAAMATGQARMAERQAAAQSAADTTIARGHLHNEGHVIAIAPELGGGPGQYVVVTEERTGGEELYAGLGSAFHVSFAEVRRVQGGFAVGAWQPQS